MTYTFAPSPSFGVSEHPFTTWENGFTSEELDKLVAYGDAQVKLKATVGGSTEEDDIKAIRESIVSWLSCQSETEWFFNRLSWITRQLNGQFYKFDLYGFCEDMQFTVYNGETNGHYTWHVDAGAKDSSMPPRKFSLVLQLSDPTDYEGGDLQVFTSAEPTSITKKRGLIAAFPSYTLHRVTPITSGIRKTLVVWASGPSFK